jgi:hypothetical protein
MRIRGGEAAFFAILASCSGQSRDARSPAAADQVADVRAGVEAWHEPQDPAKAINSPDEYAWRLFVALNWPADIANRIADGNKKLGGGGPVVWETWAANHRVYKPDGLDPGAWATLTTAMAATGFSVKRASDFQALPLKQRIRAEELGLSPASESIEEAERLDETRMNRDTFEFIRSANLYNLEGQIALAQAGRAGIAFPVGAKEIKAHWRRISPEQKSKYYWSEVTMADGGKAIFGLTGLHIITKDLPNWFWATFEHVDNPSLPGNEPWLIPSRDTFACAPDPPDCNRAPSGIGLEGTVWVNYRLRGSQTDFTTSRGVPTLLANSQIEATFQTSSSCITCHARATIAADGSRLRSFTDSGTGHVGPVRQDWFEKDGKSAYTQLDFVWSLRMAKSKAAPRTASN